VELLWNWARRTTRWFYCRQRVDQPLSYLKTKVLAVMGGTSRELGEEDQEVVLVQATGTQLHSTNLKTKVLAVMGGTSMELGEEDHKVVLLQATGTQLHFDELENTDESTGRY